MRAKKESFNEEELRTNESQESSEVDFPTLQTRGQIRHIVDLSPPRIVGGFNCEEVLKDVPQGGIYKK